ncbi:MAG: multiheme c-type cytochrome [Planctomycetota bacterium]|jgi:hypothetical protein
MGKIGTLSLVVVVLVVVAVAGDEKKALPFAPSQLTTASGKLADPDSFYEAVDCGECHVDQYKDWKGSAHSRAHHDSIYRAFAELARKEGGEELYRFCSSCHAPLALATGETAGKGKATFLTNEGVTCDVCHNVRTIRVIRDGSGMNCSIVLEEGDVRFGPLDDPVENPGHESKGSAVHKKSELCSACHTLVHPHNGLVIENTFHEWKKGPYAKAGIQCQDCHMRTVEQALEVARTMKPVKVAGRTTDDDKRDDVKAHLFVGGNTNQKLVGLGDVHTDQARKRLRGAAEVKLELAESAAAAAKTKIVVAVTNVSAGHAIPTSITELRQVWIDLRVTDANGKEIYRSGAIDADGRVDPEAVMYHSVLVDKAGKVTFKPWAAEKMIKEKLIGPKETVRESYEIAIPAGTKGALKVRCVLRYRGAPQEVMDELFGKGKYPIDIVDMTEAKASLDVRAAGR